MRRKHFDRAARIVGAIGLAVSATTAALSRHPLHAARNDLLGFALTVVVCGWVSIVITLIVVLVSAWRTVGERPSFRQFWDEMYRQAQAWDDRHGR